MSRVFTIFLTKMYIITIHDALICTENLNFSLFSQSYINGFLCFPPVQNSCPGSFSFSFFGKVDSNCSKPFGFFSQTK